MSNAVKVPAAGADTRGFLQYVRIMRLDHGVKQIFVLPGVVLAAMMSSTPFTALLAGRVLLGLIAITMIASSNYVLNEMLDAPSDRLHPTKRMRPVACGLVNLRVASLQWLALGFSGLALARMISPGFAVSCGALWIMACLYNVPPVRTKDIAYLDVTSESINNPLRFCAGWYVVTSAILPPASMLIAYWLLGAYFMALKRFGEYRQIGPERAGLYRRSFAVYTEASLLNSVVFYAAGAMLFFGAFIMRYRLELVIAFPLIALLMAVYFNLAFQPDSAVQNPERLFSERPLMALFVACVALLILLLYVKVPLLAQIFPKSAIR